MFVNVLFWLHVDVMFFLKLSISQDGSVSDGHFSSVTMNEAFCKFEFQQGV